METIENLKVQGDSLGMKAMHLELSFAREMEAREHEMVLKERKLAEA